jgi:hypothetical protein
MGISFAENWMVVAAVILLSITGIAWLRHEYARRQRRRRRFAHRRQFT